MRGCETWLNEATEIQDKFAGEAAEVNGKEATKWKRKIGQLRFSCTADCANAAELRCGGCDAFMIEDM